MLDKSILEKFIEFHGEESVLKLTDFNPHSSLPVVETTSALIP